MALNSCPQKGKLVVRGGKRRPLRNGRALRLHGTKKSSRLLTVLICGKESFTRRRRQEKTGGAARACCYWEKGEKTLDAKNKRRARPAGSHETKRRKKLLRLRRGGFGLGRGK